MKPHRRQRRRSTPGRGCSAPGRQVEAAFGPLGTHRLARLKASGEALDREGEAAVATVGAGNRERVGALEAGERKLPGMVSGPALIKPAADLGDLRAGLAHQFHHPSNPATLADQARQGVHARRRSGRDQQHKEGADRLRPVVARREEGSMEGLREVQHRHHLVHVAPEPERQALPQRQRQHGQERIDCKLAEFLGDITHRSEEALAMILGQPPCTTDERLDQVVRHLDEPEQRGGPDRQYSGPFLEPRVQSAAARMSRS